jgi:hypothetical protein
MLAHQDGLEPRFHQLLAGPGDRVDAAIQGGCDLAVAPSFARLRGVGLQQNTSLGEQPRGMFARMDQRVEPPALVIAELHHIPLYGTLFRSHEISPSLRSQRVRDSPRNQ